MRPLRLVPSGTHIDFVGKRVVGYVLSTVLILGSIGAFIASGLNFGIDFRGGILIEVKTDGPANIEELRSILGGLDLGEVQIQTFGAPDEVLIRVQKQPAVGEQAAGAIDSVENTCPLAGDVSDEEDAANDGDSNLVSEAGQAVAITLIQNAICERVTEFRRTEFVGPTVGAELIRAAILAVSLALGAILIYIWVRFEWQFGVGAVVALTHDILSTIGLFAVTQLEFNLATVAAILTIAGYSINDTVVIYDRVRETMRKYKRMPMTEVLNLALNSTLSRTVMTSLTTLLALVALALLGGSIIRDFALAMIWGVVIGTYSSVFIAVPTLLFLGLRRIAGSESAGEGEREDDREGETADTAGQGL